MSGNLIKAMDIADGAAACSRMLPGERMLKGQGRCALFEPEGSQEGQQGSR